MRLSCLFLFFAIASLPASAFAEEKSETRLRLFTPAWRNIGEQKPQDVAKKFTIIYGHLNPAPFHEGNPDALCLKYILGPYVDKAELDRIPRQAVASNARGGVVKAREWANWLVVPDSKEWLAHLETRVPALMNSDFDGLFVDSMGTAPVSEGYTDTIAINPHTRKPYTKAEWIRAENVMLRKIREIMPKGKIVTLNGLGPGFRYWTEPEENSPRALLDNVDGAMSERIWRDPKTKLTAWPKLERWMQDIRMIQDVERRGLMGFWWTKCWSNGATSRHEPGADKLVPQWLRFSLASYLLAAGPKSYFNFDTDRDDKPKSNAAEYFPEYDAPLGHAAGDMQAIGSTGAFVRRFSDGAVLVNPTDQPIPGITLPWPELANALLHSAGEKMSYRGPFELPAHTGLILTTRP